MDNVINRKGILGVHVYYFTGYFIKWSSSGLWNYDTRQTDSLLNEQDTIIKKERHLQGNIWMSLQPTLDTLQSNSIV